MLNSGKTPIFEDGLEELMQKKQKRLTYTTDYINQPIKIRM